MEVEFEIEGCVAVEMAEYKRKDFALQEAVSFLEQAKSLWTIDYALEGVSLQKEAPLSKTAVKKIIDCP